jgi:hypothetical protein
VLRRIVMVHEDWIERWYIGQQVTMQRQTGVAPAGARGVVVDIYYERQILAVQFTGRKGFDLVAGEDVRPVADAA